MKTLYKLMIGLSFMFITIPVFSQVEDGNTSNTREDTTTTATDSQRENTADRDTTVIEMPGDTITARENERIDEAREGDNNSNNNIEDDDSENLITSLNESISESATAIDIFHSVELVPQQTSMSCWAAAASMVVGWKWSVCINPEEIASEIGFWEQYDSGLTFDNSEAFFEHWDLTIQPLQTFTVEGFAGILDNGPIWVVTSGGTGGHAVVVSAMRGDGTPDGTMLTIYDPWERGMRTFRPSNRGAIYQQSYTEFVAQQEELVERVINLETIFMLAQ